MAPLLVCNIGWMSRYEGLEGKPDEIVGGGQYVNEHGRGHEVCNFLRCTDGYVYGHVETIKKDTTVRLEIEQIQLVIVLCLMAPLILNPRTTLDRFAVIYPHGI